MLGPVVVGVLHDVVQQYMMGFVFAGVLCFVAAGCAVSAWGMARALSEPER